MSQNSTILGWDWKKSGSRGDRYTQILKCRARVLQKLKGRVRRVISGSGIPGLITILNFSL